MIADGVFLTNLNNKALYVSSPISQICLVLSTKFKSEENQELCLNLLEDISTNEPETKHEQLNNKLTRFLKKLKSDKQLIFYTAAHVSFYFSIRENEKLSDLFLKLMEEYVGTGKVTSDLDLSYLSGLFTTALMADIPINSNDHLPENIKQAMEYIESEDYIVHLEKNVK